MQAQIGVIRFLCCLFVIVFVEMASTYGDPEPMARPTRPKIIASPEELKRYLDLVRDYYSLNGRARYGKRSDTVPMPEMSVTWETLKMILDAQNQQRRQDNIRQSKERIRNLQSSSAERYISRFATRPGYILDPVDKYYDDVQ